MQRVTALVLAISVSGCSFLFVHGPPPNHKQLPAFDCTSSNLVPILDTLWTGLQTLNLIVAASKNDGEWHDQFCSNGDPTCSPPLSRGAAIPTYAVLAALGAGGMLYGYSRTGQCRRAKAELSIRAAPGGYPGAYPQGPGTWPPPAQVPTGPYPAGPYPAGQVPPAGPPAPGQPAPYPPAGQPAPAPAPAPAPTPPQP